MDVSPLRDCQTLDGVEVLIADTGVRPVTKVVVQPAHLAEGIEAAPQDVVEALAEAHQMSGWMSLVDRCVFLDLVANLL